MSTIFTEVVVNGVKRLINLSPSAAPYTRDDGVLMQKVAPGRFVSAQFLRGSK